MNRGKFNYWIDVAMVPASVLSFCSGLKLHAAGHGFAYGTEQWTVAHIVVSLLFVALVCIHVRNHWGWFKRVKKEGVRGKKKMVMLLTLAFLSVAISGIILIFIGKDFPSFGMLHYKIEIVTVVLSIQHILKRRTFLLKSIDDRSDVKSRRNRAV